MEAAVPVTVAVSCLDCRVIAILGCMKTARAYASFLDVLD